jgi:hypothetical protein
MDTASASVLTRNSRWNRAPTVRGGVPQGLQLTERDHAILRLMSRYTYLPGDYIHDFVGGSKKVVLDRLGRMIRQPYCLLKRPAWQRSRLDPNYRQCIYELDDAGERLIGIGRPRAHGNADHELMACCIVASFELGVREAGNARLVSWDEIFTSSNFPAKTRDEDAAHGLPVAFHFDGKLVERTIFADSKPFGVERVIDGRKSWFFFPGVEADCKTEPVFSSNFKRSSIYLKMTAYLAAIEKDAHRSRWGVPNLYVPIVTTTDEHKRSMMHLLDRMTEGRGSKHILFGVMPGFTFLERPPPPSGRMLTTSWDRVGYPSFNILKS